MFSLDALFCDVDDVLIQSLQVGEPAQRAESLSVLVWKRNGKINF